MKTKSFGLLVAILVGLACFSAPRLARAAEDDGASAFVDLLDGTKDCGPCIDYRFAGNHHSSRGIWVEIKQEDLKNNKQRVSTYLVTPGAKAQLGPKGSDWKYSVQKAWFASN